MLAFFLRLSFPKHIPSLRNIRLRDVISLSISEAGHTYARTIGGSRRFSGQDDRTDAVIFIS